MFGIRGENVVRKLVVFVNEKEYSVLKYGRKLLAESVHQFRRGVESHLLKSFPAGHVVVRQKFVQATFDATGKPQRQIVGINAGTIQVQNAVLTLQRRLVIINVGAAEVFFKLLSLCAVVIRLDHRQENGLAEASGANDERVRRVEIFEDRQPMRLVSVGVVASTDGVVVRLSNRDAQFGLGGRQNLKKSEDKIARCATLSPLYRDKKGDLSLIFRYEAYYFRRRHVG